METFETIILIAVTVLSGVGLIVGGGLSLVPKARVSLESNEVFGPIRIALFSIFLAWSYAAILTGVLLLGQKSWREFTLRDMAFPLLATLVVVLFVAVRWAYAAGSKAR